MEVELIKFKAEDGIKLNGYRTKCNSKTDTVLIEIHGMTSNCFKKREQVIAETVKKENVDTICINTRGSEIVKYVKNSSGEKMIAGSAFEDVYDSYYDILGVIRYAISLGYTSIYLQGHSLGSTKIVYSYLKMLENNIKELDNIKGILLLSLVDLPNTLIKHSKKELLLYAEQKEKQGKIFEIMPREAFIHPVSVKTYLRYSKYYDKINFARYTEKGYNFNELNKIKIPIFMRWGNVNELIDIPANELVELMKKSLKNENKDIDYIDGANHSYENKFEILAENITNFIKKYNKRI